ncbi:hypothetical protein [Serratia sp. JSRIV006]|uniref:hypothetical protein n=1 Tax=Serratia sp. JSRIV006 TaxID=2831896 RepID=UPI001CBF9FBE|nr:hypothetical protein [Serratia sp. JSRIV006]UAN64257.1 hypothetical protein KGP16_06695 [Serratia sp. JSRIV006]
MKEREYFVISVGHTQRSSPYITLWAANNSGYRGRLETAGRYTESQIRKNLGYYNCGCDNVAVPCDAAEPLSRPVQPGFFDDDNGRWLRNNEATWKALLANVIEKPKHPARPEYRGAPRKKETK